MLDDCLTAVPRPWFTPEITLYCGWLYLRFGVSFRDFEKSMTSRGVLLSYETVRRWCDKFGKHCAAGLSGRRYRAVDKRHLDEGLP
jgi:putative transposase